MNVVCKEKANAICLNITKITPLQKSAFVKFITTCFPPICFAPLHLLKKFWWPKFCLPNTIFFRCVNE